METWTFQDTREKRKANPGEFWLHPTMGTVHQNNCPSPTLGEYTILRVQKSINSYEESATVSQTAWDGLKMKGESHHKTGGVEPIDLYKSGGILKPFAIACIIKYAFRNRNRKIVEKDLDKIEHYVSMLRVLCHEGE